MGWLKQFRKVSNQTNKLSAVFQFHPSSVATALGEINPSISPIVVIDVECESPVLSDADVMVSQASSKPIRALYMTIVVHVWKRGKSIMIARSAKDVA